LNSTLSQWVEPVLSHIWLRTNGLYSFFTCICYIDLHTIC
jgi:hypothetical protein